MYLCPCAGAQIENVLKVDMANHELFYENYAAFICGAGYGEARYNAGQLPKECGRTWSRCVDIHCSVFDPPLRVVNQWVHVSKRGQATMGTDMARVYLDAFDGTALSPPSPAVKPGNGKGGRMRKSLRR